MNTSDIVKHDLIDWKNKNCHIEGDKRTNIEVYRWPWYVIIRTTAIERKPCRQASHNIFGTSTIEFFEMGTNCARDPAPKNSITGTVNHITNTEGIQVFSFSFYYLSDPATNVYPRSIGHRRLIWFRHKLSHPLVM